MQHHKESNMTLRFFLKVYICTLKSCSGILQEVKFLWINFTCPLMSFYTSRATDKLLTLLGVKIFNFSNVHFIWSFYLLRKLMHVCRQHILPYDTCYSMCEINHRSMTRICYCQTRILMWGKIRTSIITVHIS